MEVLVGSNEFLTVVNKKADGSLDKYPLKAPNFRQIREYSKTSEGKGLEGLENLLLQLGLPEDVVNSLSLLDINAISEKMAELLTKKK
jgi:hypothetical protein